MGKPLRREYSFKGVNEIYKILYMVKSRGIGFYCVREFGEMR